MPDTSLSSTRAWLNASESRLVASSRGAALTSASPGELRRKIARARALRDKWRDVYRSQRRDTQKTRKARGLAANDRSREKSELFDQVLGRFEARLDKVAASSPQTSAGRPPSGPAKTTRARGHRQARSRVKRTLAGEVADRVSAAIRAVQASLPPMQSRTASTREEPRGRKTRGPGRKTAAARGKKKAGKTTKTTARAASKTRARTGKARSQSQSAAIRQQLKMSGRTTRLRGHVSAQGKRTQARRDRRR